MACIGPGDMEDMNLTPNRTQNRADSSLKEKLGKLNFSKGQKENLKFSILGFKKRKIPLLTKTVDLTHASGHPSGDAPFRTRRTGVDPDEEIRKIFRKF